MPSRLAAYDPQLEIFDGDEARIPPRRAEPLGEMQEMAFAAEILELSDERGLDSLVGRIVGGVARALGQRPGSPQAAATRRLVTSLLRRSMPRAAAVRGPVAPNLGDRLAAIPDHDLGLELEGLSEEDRQFETSRQLVRFAADAARRALPPSPLEPGQAARAAVLAAARRHAPALAAAAIEPGFEDRAGPGRPRLRPVPGPARGRACRCSARSDW